MTNPQSDEPTRFSTPEALSKFPLSTTDEFAYVKAIFVGEIKYAVIFLPLSCDLADSQYRFGAYSSSQQHSEFEVKFCLAEEFENHEIRFENPARRLSFSETSALARLLSEAILEFCRFTNPDLLVAEAIDNNRKLCSFYRRAYSHYASNLRNAGYHFTNEDYRFALRKTVPNRAANAC